MPTTSIGQRVKRLVDLDDAEVLELEGIGARSEEDLRYFKFEDLPSGIPLLKRRKLGIIGEYLAKGLVLSSLLTISDVQEGLHNHIATDAAVDNRSS